MVTTIAIEPEMQRQFRQLPEEAQRPETEIICAALAGYLAADRRYVEVLRQRIASAGRGELASDEEADAVFTKYAA